MHFQLFKVHVIVDQKVYDQKPLKDHNHHPSQLACIMDKEVHAFHLIYKLCKLCGIIPLTFWGCMGAIRGNLPHACSMTAQCNQSGDDCCLPKANISNNHHTPVHTGISTLQLYINLLEHPIPANKYRLCGDAGHLKKQRFKRDIRRSVRCKAYCKRIQEIHTVQQFHSQL